MDLRECEGIYKCGKGTDELCRKALCPFYKPQKKERKVTVTKYQPKRVKEGKWILDDLSGLWRYTEE